MKLIPSIAVSAAVGAGLVLAMAMVLLLGGFGISRDTHPPCDQLPTTAEAAAALVENQELADEIKALGTDIAVEVHNPCSEEEGRGLIRITYDSKSDRKAIDSLIISRDGFGVPLYMVKR